MILWIIPPVSHSSPGPPAEHAFSEIKLQRRQLREAAERFQRPPALGASASGLQQFRDSHYSQNCISAK